MAGAKRKYIEAAYELLLNEGLDGVSIRNVAEKVGCSSAALYRHFPDINQLVAVASIRFLRDYIDDARLLSQVEMNPLELNLQLWECLAYYSFRNADIYENLFFGSHDEDLYTAAANEYFEQYPEDIDGLKDFMREMFMNSTIAERDSILLDKAVEAGMLSHESAEYLSKVDSYLYRGVLATVRSSSLDEEGFRAKTHEFMQLIIRNYLYQLEDGYSILVVSPDFAEKRPKKEFEARSSYRVQFTVQKGQGKRWKKASA